MLRVRGHRPAAGLKPSDYDHEIDLVNHDDAPSPSPVNLSSGAGAHGQSTASRLTSVAGVTEQEEGREAREESRQSGQQETARIGSDGQQRDRSPDGLRHGASSPFPAPGPLIEVYAPTTDAPSPGEGRIVPKKTRHRQETAIDILYENERGGFLCGAALFSSRALGGLDPPAWTNVYHKSSPTSIHTAQVPDPSWEWVWPEWRVNHQQGTDAGGWRYSFAFYKSFSWHGPKWWNSFVRRRAWIRKRAKKPPQDISADAHMLNSDYFTIQPASYRSHRSNGSLASSRAISKSSMTRVSIYEAEDEQPDIEDIETLLQTLRFARIDREKREAVENYLEHAVDLSRLQDEMHEIMSLFVFQASRRQLLSYLMQKHDETIDALGNKDKENTAVLLERKDAIDAAISHADEEVRNLAYWSDVKQMAEGEQMRHSTDLDRGWYGKEPRFRPERPD